MTKLQLEAIVEVYNMLSKGLTHPQKINQVYQYINPMSGIEVPQRAKILAINRFMLLSYADVQKQLKVEEEVLEMEAITESIGTIENRDRQSHSEKSDNGDNQDIQQFLTKKEKSKLKEPEAGTTLEIVSNDGKKKRTRKPRS